MSAIVRCSSDGNQMAVSLGSTRRYPTIRGEFPLSLQLRHGSRIHVELGYELGGNHEGPLLIVAGGISAGRHCFSSAEFPEPGWWEAQKAAFPLDRFQLLSVDWLAADGAIDLVIDPTDQADAIAGLLAGLRLDRRVAFVGASYGGMVGMHFAARHGPRAESLLAIGAAAHSHPYSSACRSLQREALSLGEKGGNAAAGVALARAMAMLTYRTPEEFSERFASPPVIERGRVRIAADEYLAAQGARHCGRMSLTAYRRLSESIDLHRVDPSDIRIPLTLAAVDQDRLVPAADVESLAEAVPDARFHLIRSCYGHDAFLKETGQVRAILDHFLSHPENRQ